MRASSTSGSATTRGEGSSPSPRAPAVAISGLRKRYGGVVALDGAALTVERGTIHAVVGENGAGKSTLMKILAGAVRRDGGEVAIDGERVQASSTKDARMRGIGIVHQELALFPTRSVLANLFVQGQPRRWGLVSRPEMRRRAAGVLRDVGLDVDVDAPVAALTIGERQLVEICRVLLTEPRVLILDEPNSALSLWETERLFTVLRALRAAGMTMLYVSHRLEEVFDIADRITVMRNGRDVLTRPTGELTIPEVIEAMIGAHQEELFPPRVEDGARPPEPGAAGGTSGAGDEPGILRVRDLSVGDRLSGVSFEARPGEVVGLAGLEGSGVAQVLGALFGTVKRSGGEIELPDGKGAAATPTAAARRGIALVPADRRVGLMTEADVAENVAHVSVGALRARSPWLRRRELHRRALRQMGELQIKAPSPSARVDHLSGGNQQKVVLAKWLETGPSVVLLDDPTRGVDVGAKREIYGIVRRLSADGRIIVFRSSELPELAGLADRILVFYRGRLVGEVTGAAVDSRALLHAINTGELAAPTTEGDLT